MSVENENLYLDKLVSKPTPKGKPQIVLKGKEVELKITVETKNVPLALKRTDFSAQLGQVIQKKKLDKKKVLFTEFYPETVEDLRLGESGLNKNVKIPFSEPEEPVPVEEPVEKEPAPIEEPLIEEPAPIEEPLIEEPAPIEEPTPVEKEPPAEEKTTLEELVEEEPPAEEKTTLEEETEEEPPAEVPKKKAKAPPKKKGKDQVAPDAKEINDVDIQDRLPKSVPLEKIVLRAPTYYMSNRKLYSQRIADLFAPFAKEINLQNVQVSCDNIGSSTGNRDLFIHQRIVREYLNLYTPYRGLLLYHGLGSGKTCTSIALAEGAKSQKRVFVLTPASLKMNFFSELKKCGDPLYKKNQYWEFISIAGRPEYVDLLSNALSISRETIKKNGGAWLQDIRKSTPNFGDLTGDQQKMLDNQINEMIRAKYIDVNYNGLNKRRLDELQKKHSLPGSNNPFDHSVVLVDEAHNLVSRVVNQLRIDKKRESVSLRLYDFLQSAKDVRVVFMTGTPIINYPHELGVLFNMLRGNITTWKFKVPSLGKENLLDIFTHERFNTYDYVDYSNDTLTITRNPWGFVNSLHPGHVRKTGGRKTEDRKPREKKTKRKKLVLHNTTKKQPILPITNPEIVYTDPGEIKEGLLHPHESTPVPVSHEISDQIEEEIKHEINQDGDKDNNPHSGGSTLGTDFTNEHSGAAFLGGASLINPRYKGVHLDEQGNISDEDFKNRVLHILKKHNIEVSPSVSTVAHSCLPDNLDDFTANFVDMNTLTIKRTDVLQKRVVGLTSYFRSAQETLLPRFLPSTDKITPNYHPVLIPMSNHQFIQYSKVRTTEINKEPKKPPSKSKENEKLLTISSSYRVFSRALCNFAFPEDVIRPLPPSKSRDLTASDLDNVPDELEQDLGDGQNAAPLSKEYAAAIQASLDQLERDGEKYLSKDALNQYSPKFLRILENVADPENRGLHLVYSTFRTLEGIGILRLVLLANGFAEFKLKKTGDLWSIAESDKKKPHFVLYTGTETEEEREMIRNIYNSNWDLVPANLSTDLKKIHENNFYGEIIKTLMITSSGAEGINLENTRFVHIVEPYWHMVRVDQVVGRARRICSHRNLPEELRTIKVFLYMCEFTEKQKMSDANLTIMTRDTSRLYGTEGKRENAVTTDQALYEIAVLKNNMTKQLLNSVKESAVDCSIHDTKSEGLVCYEYGFATSNEFSSFPTYQQDQEVREGTDVKAITGKLVVVPVGQDKYIHNTATDELYDYAAFKSENSKKIVVGRMENGRPVLLRK